MILEYNEEALPVLAAEEIVYNQQMEKNNRLCCEQHRQI